MTDDLTLIESLDGLRDAIQNRDHARAAALKLEGEVARLSGVVIALLRQAEPEAVVVNPRAGSGAHLRGPFSSGAIAADIMAKLADAPEDGVPAKELLPDGFKSGAPLGMLSRQHKAKKLPNGNWVAV